MGRAVVPVAIPVCLAVIVIQAGLTVVIVIMLMAGIIIRIPVVREVAEILRR
jgi:hypothetical protein